MPLFLRPVYSDGGSTRACVKICSPLLYGVVRKGLRLHEFRDCPSIVRNNVHFRKISQLQDQYVRYIKKVANYAYQHNLPLRIADSRMNDHRNPEVPTYLLPVATIGEAERALAILWRKLARLENKIASLSSGKNSVAKDSAFKIFSEVAMNKKLEATAEEFINNYKVKYEMFREDLKHLYNYLRQWLALYSKHNELEQLLFCLRESQQIKRKKSPWDSRLSQLGYTCEMMEKLFEKARTV